MSRNGSGTYSLPAGNPVVTNEVISSTWANTTLSDIASALTDSLSRTGLGGMTNPLQLPNGTVGAPSLTFSAESTLGFYRAGAGDVRLAAGGVDIVTFTDLANLGDNNIFTGSNTFTKTFASGAAGPVILTSAQPVFELDQSGAAVNQRRWWMTATGEELLLQAANDARTSATTFMQVTRTNNTADAINFTSTALNWNGAAMVNVNSSPTWTEQHTFAEVTNAAAAFVGSNSNSAGVRVFIGNTSPAVDNRYWGMRVNENGDFRMGVWSDANFPTGSETSNFLAVERTGTTITGVVFQTDSSAAFRIGTSPAVINSSRLVVGTASNVGAAQFENNAGSSSTPTVYITNAGTAGDSGFIRFATDSSGLGTERGSIDFNRAGVATRYNTTCDGGLKENIVDSGSALSLLRQLSVRSFRWRTEKSLVPFGFIAQEVYPLLPEAVSPGDDKRPWGMDFSKLVPLHTKVLQELDARLTAAGL